MVGPRWQGLLVSAPWWLGLPLAVTLAGFTPGSLIGQSTLLLLFNYFHTQPRFSLLMRDPNELLARVRRILQITAPLQSQQELLFDDGNLQVDEAARKLQLRQEAVALTRKEWAVLLQLMHSPGRLVTQSALLERIWGKTHVEDTQYLRNVIQKLRQKLHDDPAHPRYLETEPGVGYRFIPVIDQSG